jgi:hypoxanthine-DNA glycosylase
LTGVRKSAFPPVVAANTRVLILGSLPGEASLAAGRYYAHPRNHFWRLAGAIIERKDLPLLGYEARLDALLARGIGLWDTIASAQRAGSLDAAIRIPEAAPLARLVASLPELRAIGFNGGTAARVGRSTLVRVTGTDPHAGPPALIDLPSSSPAYAAMPFAQKSSRWLLLREYLA